MCGGIAESARSRLQRSSYSALKDVGCTCRDGTLELQGFLPSYYLKQVAQTLVTGVDGVTAVVNRIEVTPHRPHQAPEVGRGA
jgi:osmotically-inducible protein OsmY